MLPWGERDGTSHPCHMIAMIRDKVAEGVAESAAGSLKRSRKIAGVTVSGGGHRGYRH
jgi:hypothetical protein